MGIRLKLNLVLLTVAAVGIGVYALISWPFLTEQAREEVVVRARIMMASATGIRKYTVEEVVPLLNLKGSEKFDRPAVASYAATKNFSVLRTQFPDYNYREAALNPTNPANRAAVGEVDIINDFRANPTRTELLTERDTQPGRVLYLSRPLIATKACLNCHDTPDVAPLPMLAEYGRQNGFGWKLNEIVGAQIVSVPMAVPLANAAKTLGLSLLLLAAVFAFLIVLLNILLSFSIIHPVLRMSRVAGEASMGKANVEEYVKSGSDELASLSASLNRMKRSMDEAIKLLQPAHGKPLHAQPIGAPVDLGHDSRGSSTTAGGGRAPTRILTDLQGAVKLVPIGGGSPLVLGGDRLAGDGIVLGRDAQCDVVIPETEVSNRHARLSLDGSGMIEVEDLGSSNGTWQGATRITTAVFRDGETIKFGNAAFQIRILTKIQDSVKFVPVGGGSPLVLDGDRLAGDGIVLGRDAQCDVIISDIDVSNRHARLSLDGSGMMKVEDLGSSNGTWQGATRITTAEFQEGETIKFGSAAYRIDMGGLGASERR